MSTLGIDKQTLKADSATGSSARSFADQDGSSQRSQPDDAAGSGAASRTSEDSNFENISKEEETRSDLATLKNFVKEMESAAHRLMDERRQFNKVVVVCCYWEEARNLGHMKKHAVALAELLEVKYGFDVLPYAIPNGVTSRQFMRTIDTQIDKVIDDPDSLFIFYYGGHAIKVDEEGNFCRKFRADITSHSYEIDWKSASSLMFEKVACQKLLILDCCHAGAMTEIDGGNLGCEILGACSADSKAGALKNESFTKAVIEELRSSEGSANDLFSILCSTWKKHDYNLKADPWYMNYTQNPSAGIRALNFKDRAQSKSVPAQPIIPKSDARILIKVRFTGTAAGFLKQYAQILKDWERWFYHAPSGVAPFLLRAVEETQLISLWDASSCLAIWALPTWLWGSMPLHESYQYLGVVRGTGFVSSAAPTPLLRDSSSSDNKVAINVQPMVPLIGPSSIKASHPPIDDPDDQRVVVGAASTTESGTQTDKRVTLPKAPTPPTAPTSPRPSIISSPKLALSKVKSDLSERVHGLTKLGKPKSTKSKPADCSAEKPAKQPSPKMDPPSPPNEANPEALKRGDFDYDDLLSYWPVPAVPCGVSQLDALVPAKDQKLAAEILSVRSRNKNDDAYLNGLWSAPELYVPPPKYSLLAE